MTPLCIYIQIFIFLLLSFIAGPVHSLSAAVPSEAMFDEAETVPPISGGLIGGMGAAVYNFTAAPRAPKIFADTLGSAVLQEAGRSMSGPGSVADVTQTKAWQSYRVVMERHYGNDAGMGRYLADQAGQLNAAAKTGENWRFALRNKMKGAGGESVVNGMYRRGGWEQLDSKLGVQGIDAIYVRRTKNGAIRDILIVESKTGKAKLGNTKVGRQMSKDWILKGLNGLRKKAGTDFLAAINDYDSTTKEALIAQYKDIEAIERHVAKNGRVRFSLATTTIVADTNGKPMLRVDFSKLNYDDVSTGEVSIGKSRTQFAIDLSKPPKLWTPTERAIINDYFVDMKQILLDNPAVSKKQADLAMTTIKKGIVSIDSDVALNSLIDKSLRNANINPTDVQSTMVTLGAAKPGRLAHVWSHSRAGALGATSGGLMAAFFEWKTTDRVSFANSGRETLIGGGIDGGTALLERTMAKGADKLAQRQLAKNTDGRVLSKAFSPASFGRYGGAVVLIGTSAGFAIYEFNKGNISGYQAAAMTTESIAVGAVSILAATKVGAAVGTGGGPLGTVAGAAVGMVIGTGYYVSKEVILGGIERKHLMAMQQIDDEQQAARKKKLEKEERERLERESEQLLAEAGEFLSASRARY